MNRYNRYHYQPTYQQPQPQQPDKVQVLQQDLDKLKQMFEELLQRFNDLENFLMEESDDEQDGKQEK